jgi:hypothetical protein
MERFVLAAALALLSSCVTVRVGAGVSHRGDSGAAAATWDTELGVTVPVTNQWSVSALSVVRARSPDGGRPLLGVEAARILRGAAARSRSGDVWTPEPSGTAFLLGGRVEVGRDDLGRYLGGAAVARAIFPWEALSPFLPSLSLVLTGGWYDGPVHGPAVGLNVLAGFW